MIDDNAQVFGNAWVYGNAQVFGNAWVYGNAHVCHEAEVYGNARVFGNALVRDNVQVCSYARVFGNAIISGDAIIEDMGDYVVFQNTWSSGRWFTWTRSNNMWKVGCFYGTGEELVKRAYEDDAEKGRCYESTVNYVNTLYKIGSLK